MNVIGAELLERQPNVKFILNDAAVVFFFSTQQHRDLKAHGLSYEDDYRGNAVAGVVSPDRVNIRFHQAYSDERIRHLWRRVLSAPEMAGKRLAALYYQGRAVTSV